MKLIKKNTFEQLCDTLAEAYDYSKDEYKYTRDYLKENYLSDLDILWKIKAEANDMSFLEYTTFKIAVLALIYSSVDVIIGIFPVETFGIGSSILYLIILGGITIILLRKSKFVSVSKWRKYVLGAIEEIEREVYSNNTLVDSNIKIENNKIEKSNNVEKKKGKKKSKKRR